MNMLLLSLPYLISLATGLFLTNTILKEELRHRVLLHFSLAFGLGLGISAYIGYLNFMFLNKFSLYFQASFNIFVLGLSFLGALLTKSGTPPGEQDAPKSNFIWDGLYFAAFLLLFAPLYYIASFYPYGGWDAWAVWHFKAKFLFLSGETWRNMFDPLLWQSSPHYPLLLPLINVWAWVFQSEPTYFGPMATSLLFTFLTFTLLVSSLALVKKDKFGFLFSCVLLSSPFYTKTSISQYADVVLGFYLLAGLACLIAANLRNKRRFAFLGGLFIGFLSFAKPEGLVAALLVIGLTSFFYFYVNGRKLFNDFFVSFLIGSSMTLLPSLLFYFFVAPENVSSVNGFLSQANPSSWLRLKTILIFIFVELISYKWNGLWIAAMALIIFNIRGAVSKNTWLLPSFLIFYTMAIITYYLMNTYFEVVWWLSVSLSRILASVLPVVFWWIILSFRKRPPKAAEEN